MKTTIVLSCLLLISVLHQELSIMLSSSIGFGPLLMILSLTSRYSRLTLSFSRLTILQRVFQPLSLKVAESSVKVGEASEMRGRVRMYQPTIPPTFHPRANFKFLNANPYSTHHRSITAHPTRYRLSAASRWLVTFLNSNSDSFSHEQLPLTVPVFRSMMHILGLYTISPITIQTHLWLKCWRECSFIFISFLNIKPKIDQLKLLELASFN